MTKSKKLKIGYSDFQRIVEEDGYFVDKTLFIKDFIDNASQVLLIPRPRRFGKTLNLSMTEYFLSIEHKSNAHLFKDFQIAKETEFCESYQNRFPVINLSLKSIRGTNWEACLQQLKIIISELYKKNDFLLDSDKLKSYEKNFFEDIILEKATTNHYETGLKLLSKYLEKHFKTKVIILVDEYDTPIINGFLNSYYSEIVSFMQVFLGSAYKENPHLQKGMITGIMRIARESIFSEMNNIGVFSIINYQFSDKFGFTQKETEAITSYFGLENQMSNIREWYNGYKFGTTESIYNPWSIVNYIYRHQEGFRPYWVNTGTDSIIKKRLVEPDADNTFSTLEKLISGESVEKLIGEEFVFTDFDLDKDLLWTVLFFSGYLTLDKQIESDVFMLRIPNYEVKKVFKNIIIKWFQTDYKLTRSQLVHTAEHLVNNRLSEFEKGFRQIMGDTFSYFDTAKNPEYAYQAYVLGLLAIIGDDYLIKSNRESGEGRYDILLLPHDKKCYGVVLELKQIAKQSEKESKKEFATRINEKLSHALEQIERNEYYKELVENKIANNKIIKLPIVFAGKVPYVMTISEE